MRVLLVEDEDNIIHFLKPGLEKACFAVDVAKDGERGSYLARTNDYDIIILDNALPLKNGQEICKEIRKLGRTVPIIMLSVISDIDTKIQLLNSGADDYLTKPFSINELLARMRALLRRPVQIEPEILKIGDLEINTFRGTVFRTSKEIKLTRKEYMLLIYLARNRKQIVSRGMLLEHVWDINADPFSNTIESHILSLRKKLDPKKNKSELITTVSGRGYKISV